MAQPFPSSAIDSQTTHAPSSTTESPSADSNTPAASVQPSVISQSPDVSAMATMPNFNTMASLNSGSGATLGAAGIPSLIGDFFGGGYNYAVGGPFQGATVTTAGGDRRLKLSENNSPFPRDRVFFNYNHFHNALTDLNGNSRNVNKYTFGVESTIINELNSIELRVPFSGTLNASQVIGEDFNSTEFGNISIALKHMLYYDECTAMSAGMAFVLPTGRDSEIFNDIGDLQILFENESVHIQPFIGLARRPTQQLFWQFFSQLDFDTAGNGVVIPGNSILRRTNPDAGPVSTLQDQTLLMLDLSVGYWIYQNGCGNLVTGVAPMLELHYTSTLDDLDTIDGVFEPTNRRDSLNFTAGLVTQLRGNSSLRVGLVSPLREGFDRFFDAELGVQLVRGF